MKQKKSFGFYVTLICIALCAVTAIVYPYIYGDSRYMSMTAEYFLIGGAVLALLLTLIKKVRFAPAVLLTASLVATMLYIYGIYFFISSALVGIQYSGFPPEFIANAACFGGTLVLSILNVFFPQVKK